MKTKIASLLLASAFSLAAFQAGAADKVALQLKWVTQAQFGGYYVAKDKGFYEEEGLDVEIKPGGPDIAPAQVIAGGGADVIVDWMPSALASREKGVPLVNIAQPFKSSGMMLTCLKESGVKGPEDFKGKTLGVWFFGNEYPFLSWMSHLKIPTEGGPDGVTVLKQGFNVDPLIQKQAVCISTMTYNEYWQVIDAGIKPEDLVTFKYEDQGVATLEDGLYVLEDKLKDPAFKEKMVKFVRASMKGWKYAEQNPDEAADIGRKRADGKAIDERRDIDFIDRLDGTGGNHPVGEGARFGGDDDDGGEVFNLLRRGGFACRGIGGKGENRVDRHESGDGKIKNLLVSKSHRPNFLKSMTL